MYSYYVYNRRNKLNQEGEAPVELCIYHNRNDRDFKSPDVYLKPHQWDKENKKIINHPNARELTAKMRKFQVDMEEKTEARLLEPGETYHTFNKFYQAHLKEQTTLTNSTRSSHQQTLDHLNGFNPQLQWEQINHSFPDRFERYLFSQGLGINTIAKHHKNVKVYLNQAITYGHFTDSAMKWPYRKFKVKKTAGNKEPLSEDELNRIIGLKLTGKLNLVRDMFLMACYTGLRFSDIQTISYKDMDNWVLISENVKTGTIVHLPLNQLFGGKPMEIYNKYFDKDKAYLFPTIQNSTINALLKEIREKARINKPLSFHTSRHTFLTTIAAKTGDVFQVKRLGGIKKTETAMVYIHLADERFSDKLKEITW